MKSDGKSVVGMVSSCALEFCCMQSIETALRRIVFIWNEWPLVFALFCRVFFGRQCKSRWIIQRNSHKTQISIKFWFPSGQSRFLLSNPFWLIVQHNNVNNLVLSTTSLSDHSVICIVFTFSIKTHQWLKLDLNKTITYFDYTHRRKRSDFNTISSTTKFHFRLSWFSSVWTHFKVVNIPLSNKSGHKKFIQSYLHDWINVIYVPTPFI